MVKIDFLRLFQLSRRRNASKPIGNQVPSPKATDALIRSLRIALPGKCIRRRWLVGIHNSRLNGTGGPYLKDAGADQLPRSVFSARFWHVLHQELKCRSVLGECSIPPDDEDRSPNEICVAFLRINPPGPVTRTSVMRSRQAPS